MLPALWCRLRHSFSASEPKLFFRNVAVRRGNINPRYWHDKSL